MWYLFDALDLVTGQLHVSVILASPALVLIWRGSDHTARMRAAVTAPALGRSSIASMRAHSETVVRGFYGFHLEGGRG